jgi:hypothetical protein
MASAQLIQAVAVTAELCGRTFSPEAAAVFVNDLDGLDELAVASALKRCRREVRGTLTVQDVVSRINDGRPGPDEAWAMLPKDEDTTVVWSEEMREAWGVAIPLLEFGDKVGARFAFREAYMARVNAARDARRPPNWIASLGHDKRGREHVLAEAVSAGRLSLTQAQSYVPQLNAPAVANDRVLALLDDVTSTKRLAP